MALDGLLIIRVTTFRYEKRQLPPDRIIFKQTVSVSKTCKLACKQQIVLNLQGKQINSYIILPLRHPEGGRGILPPQTVESQPARHLVPRRCEKLVVVSGAKWWSSPNENPSEGTRCPFLKPWGKGGPTFFSSRGDFSGLLFITVGWKVRVKTQSTHIKGWRKERLHS